MDEGPRKWHGTKALPDWLGIDCSHDMASFAVAAYHSDEVGELPGGDIDAMFGTRGGGNVAEFIEERSAPLLGPASTMQDGIARTFGRCLVALIYEVRMSLKRLV